MFQNLYNFYLLFHDKNFEGGHDVLQIREQVRGGIGTAGFKNELGRLSLVGHFAVSGRSGKRKTHSQQQAQQQGADSGIFFHICPSLVAAGIAI